MAQMFKVMKKRLTVELNWFSSVIFHKWVLSKINLEIFFLKAFCFLFRNWILQVIKKSSFYLLRKPPKTYNEFFLGFSWLIFVSDIDSVVLFHDTRSNDTRFIHKYIFLVCHEQTDRKGSSLYRIENFTS